MRFAAGEGLRLGSFTERVDFLFGDQVVWEDDLDLGSPFLRKTFNLFDGCSNPFPFGSVKSGPAK
jgi:hypothetical protein